MGRAFYRKVILKSLLNTFFRMIEMEKEILHYSLNYAESGLERWKVMEHELKVTIKITTFNPQRTNQKSQNLITCVTFFHISHFLNNTRLEHFHSCKSLCFLLMYG